MFTCYKFFQIQLKYTDKIPAEIIVSQYSLVGLHFYTGG